MAAADAVELAAVFLAVALGVVVVVVFLVPPPMFSLWSAMPMGDTYLVAYSCTSLRCAVTSSLVNVLQLSVVATINGGTRQEIELMTKHEMYDAHTPSA